MALPRDLPQPLEWQGLLAVWCEERSRWEIEACPSAPQECVRAVAMCSFRAREKILAGHSGMLPAIGSSAAMWEARRCYKLWRDAKNE